jgi:hypothetical protein
MLFLFEGQTGQSLKKSKFYVEIKCQLDATDEFLLHILLLAQHVSGHHYAHHQDLESIIQVVAACRIWCLVFKLSVLCGAEGCVSSLRAADRNMLSKQ